MISGLANSKQKLIDRIKVSPPSGLSDEADEIAILKTNLYTAEFGTKIELKPNPEISSSSVIFFYRVDTVQVLYFY